jgi:hypothetical protein
VAQELTRLVDIDFLPAAYRQRSMQRRAYAWRVAAAVVIACFFAATSLWQRNHHESVRARLDAVEDQYTGAAAKNALLAEVTARFHAQRATAELVTFLRHPWPRTQILAAVLEPLPESIVLSDWHVGHETVQRTDSPSIALPEAKNVPPDKPSRQAADLKRLLFESGGQEHFVFLSGRAGDAATLHEYLARLDTNPLFARIDLRSLEHLKPDGSDVVAPGQVQFSVRAILAPGHGQILPPRPPTPATAPAPIAPPLAHKGS